MFLRRLALALCLPLPACGSTAVRQPPGKPPSPATVSVAEPGGDAHDPHAAALQRQLEAPWGRRNDKDDQLHVPTPDWEHWKRVRYWGVPHFSGWRYGDDHHVAAVAVLLPLAPAEANDSASCQRRFDAWARPRARAYGVVVSERGVSHQRWRDQPLVVQFAHGHVDSGFEREHYSAAWAAYPAYPETCLVYAMAVPWRGQEALARRVVERWVREGFSRLLPLTETRPERKP